MLEVYIWFEVTPFEVLLFLQSKLFLPLSEMKLKQNFYFFLLLQKKTFLSFSLLLFNGFKDQYKNRNERMNGRLRAVVLNRGAAKYWIFLLFAGISNEIYQ